MKELPLEPEAKQVVSMVVGVMNQSAPERPLDAAVSINQYAKALRVWLGHCYIQAWPWPWVQNPVSLGTWLSVQGTVGHVPQPTPYPIPFAYTLPGPQSLSAQPQAATRQHHGLEFDVPSLSLRLLAEAVDFLILCCFKVSITLAVLYRSGIKDPANFAIHLMIEDIGDETTMEDLQRMLLIALVYRLFVCFYETVCIWGVGGATPGKFVLGLRVLSCDSCVSVHADRVLLQRPTNVGFIA
uniref:Family with sequence similarity 8 member A1a n=1 Tax=Eptatretus burgeri TaxID=7764 RepID=A0A8C4Q1H6_EPTBU